MRLAILLFGSALLVSCTSSKDSQLPIFNGLQFQLLESDSLIEETEGFGEEFRTYTEKKGVQIPLFQVIQGEEYKIYLGIPFNTTLDELGRKPINSSNEFITKKDSTFYHYMAFDLDTVYLVELSVKLNNSLIYVLAQTESAEKLSNALNAKQLVNRIKVD